MRVSILGPLRVVAAGEVVEIGGTRLRVLLVRLALGAGRVVTVEELSDALWPDGRPGDPTNAVQSLVSRLRRVLPGASALRSDHGGYLLDVPPDAVDAHRFERLAREGRRALGNGDPVTASNLLREALGLWRGPALGEVATAPFAVAYAAGLEEARLAATEDRVEAELGCGRHSPLVTELQELTARHPLRERLHGLRVRALYAAGRQAEALAAYEEFRRGLAEELGADPGPELREIHLAVLRADPALRAARDEAPPARTGTRGNLRAALTTFVGRTAEIGLIGARLDEGRLVTLVGPGGVGKTRIATTVAAGISGRMPGGAWLVELAPVTDPADVAQAVLGALGFPAPADARAGTSDTMARLAELLSSTETLVVLDNCEHLVDGRRAPGRRPPGALPGAADPRHQQGAARDRRGGTVPGAPARPARARRHGGGGPDRLRGAALRRPGVRRASGVRRHRRQRGPGDGDLPAAGRAAARDRAGRRPAALPHRRAARRAAGRPFPACSPEGAGSRCPGTGRCARSSPGAGTCSTTRSAGSRSGSRCSPRASHPRPPNGCALPRSRPPGRGPRPRSRPPPRNPAPLRSPAPPSGPAPLPNTAPSRIPAPPPTPAPLPDPDPVPRGRVRGRNRSWTGSRPCWTSPCCSSPRVPVTACWRRSGSTRWSA
ncbi:BTAD domain-containing putative transcriptional regulator [Streptosporangium vulgare]|uniref:BTAD domain-containing putative transcriptional regulator n=1 Tax=Streptosporangium vulgare TaxID=46190 RepID=UPI0031D65331